MGKIYFSKTAQKLYLAHYLPFVIGYFLVSTITLGRILTSNILAVALSILITLVSLILIRTKTISSQGGKSKSHAANWTWAVSILTSLYSVHYLLSNSNFVLKSFPERTIGIAVLEGLDLAFRSSLYPILILVFILVFFLSYHAYHKLDTFLAAYLTDKYISNERRALFSLSLASIFTLIFHYLNGAEIIVKILDIFLFLILLNFTILLIKIYALNKKVLLLKLLNRYDLIVLSFLAPLVVFFLRWVLINGSFIFTYKFFYAFTFLWASFWFSIYIFVKAFSKGKSDRVANWLLLAAIPFLLIPISIPLSNELQFSFSGISTISARSVSLFTIGILLATSFFIFIISAKRSVSLKFHFASNFYLPIFVATLVMFNMHSNFIEMPNGFDMFHHGENLVSTQQLFSFKNIPFIDIYPTHGISYMVGQVLYSLINGYRAFEPWLWEWITKIFEILLLYFVLKKITNSFFAGTVIVFLPIIGIFGGQHFTYGYNTSLVTTYYFAAMAPALSLAWLLKKPNFTRLVTHWLICLFLVLWRVDFGLACLAATMLIFLGIFLSKEIKGYEIPISPKQVILSLGLTAGSLFLIGLIISTLKNEPFLGLLTLNLQFVKFQAQAQGLITLATTISPLVIFQYFVLPAIGVFYVVFFIICIFRGQISSFGQSRWLLLFLAIFSLIMSIRSVQRQTLAVLGYNPYLFVFLGISIPFYLKTLKKEASITLFLLMLLGYHFILPNNTMLLKEGQLVNLYDWNNRESRVRINDYQYKDLARFLNNNLSDGQTFLDLTSSPMLYVVTNRKFINYFIPSVYHTSEPIQKFTLERLIKAYENGKIPIVIFRQPDNYANNIDGVPNEIRSYRIYEFIYKNYKPAGYINGYMIWLANNYSLPRPADLIPVKTFSQDFDLKKLPYIWGAFDEYKAKENTAVLSFLIKESKIIDPGEPFKLFFDMNIDKSSGNYLHLTIRADEEGALKLSYGSSPQSSVNIYLIPSEKSVDYLIRISSQWAWMSQSFDSIGLTTTSKAEIVKAFIRKGD